MIQIGCAKHPRYTAKRKPSVPLGGKGDCVVCWILYHATYATVVGTMFFAKGQVVLARVKTP